jgi:hypothetical protein
VVWFFAVVKQRSKIPMVECAILANLTDAAAAGENVKCEGRKEEEFKMHDKAVVKMSGKAFFGISG